MSEMDRLGGEQIGGEPDQPDFTASAKEELAYRLQQQKLVSEFGLFALRCTSLDEIMHQATLIGAQGLNVELCKFLHYRPVEADLLVRAGVGWEEGTIGVVSLATDMASPAGYAFQTGQPVLSNHLDTETRFRTPKLLVDHGVRRALNVPVRDGGTPHGVLEADSRNSYKFTQADITFLQGIANVLSVVIERAARRRELNEALERERLLGGEMRHRVKNLFTVVNSLISLSKREADTNGHPEKAIVLLGERVSALARASQAGLAALDRDGTTAKKMFDPIETSKLVLMPYETRVTVSSGHAIQIEFDLTTLALLIHELATNAVKYGALSKAGGTVHVEWMETEEGVAAIWSEEGGPEISSAPVTEGFGLKLIRRMLQAAGGQIDYDWRPGGLVATVRFRRPVAADQ
ncbi:GAF domain-containing protein [Fulvimarina sp. 2208YS6-2-32]|uniref:histidine kinase n=1 Tax=Fulvimarina uroteuthidis TaxID=3098149 RepID=A0ABU5HZB7_9HYPH|nr:GAF domain-containing protein [Fulvimarina sp. 2208YS6-2-32]MDY8108427.1 GAF domain-containing protein [Fulvimarina sp. 2208YS6-2-32]